MRVPDSRRDKHLVVESQSRFPALRACFLKTARGSERIPPTNRVDICGHCSRSARVLKRIRRQTEARMSARIRDTRDSRGRPSPLPLVCCVGLERSRGCSWRRESFVVGRRGNFEDGEEGFLRDVHLADALHAALAFFLFFEEFAFARNVAAVALGKYVLANRRNGFARNHAAANRRLNRHFEHLARNQFSQTRYQFTSA